MDIAARPIATRAPLPYNVHVGNSVKIPGIRCQTALAACVLALGAPSAQAADGPELSGCLTRQHFKLVQVLVASDKPVETMPVRAWSEKLRRARLSLQLNLNENWGEVKDLALIKAGDTIAGVHASWNQQDVRKFTGEVIGVRNIAKNDKPAVHEATVRTIDGKLEVFNLSYPKGNTVYRLNGDAPERWRSVRFVTAAEVMADPRLGLNAVKPWVGEVRATSVFEPEAVKAIEEAVEESYYEIVRLRELATPAPPEEVTAVTDTMIARVSLLLEARGVSHQVHEFDGHLHGLLILPDSTTELGRFAQGLSEKMNGVTLEYNPGLIQIASKGSAAYGKKEAPSGGKLFLSGLGFIHGKPAMANEGHEIVHAAGDHAIHSGVGMAAAGSARNVRLRGRSAVYNEFLSLDEVVTYAYTVHLDASAVVKELRTGAMQGTHGRSAIGLLRANAEAYDQVTQAAEQVVNQLETVTAVERLLSPYGYGSWIGLGDSGKALRLKTALGNPDSILIEFSKRTGVPTAHVKLRGTDGTAVQEFQLPLPTLKDVNDTPSAVKLFHEQISLLKQVSSQQRKQAVEAWRLAQLFEAEADPARKLKLAEEMVEATRRLPLPAEPGTRPTGWRSLFSWFKR